MTVGIEAGPIIGIVAIIPGDNDSAEVQARRGNEGRCTPLALTSSGETIIRFTLTHGVIANLGIIILGVRTLLLWPNFDRSGVLAGSPTAFLCST